MPRLRLRTTAAAESRLRAGHPWLYAESIREQNRLGRLGELAVVYDRKDRFLAAGLFDPSSPIRLRVLQAGRPETIDREWWKRRLRHPLDRRQELQDSSERLATTGFRWINGESDGWPGLVLDRYDKTLVLKLYTAAWLPRLAELAEIIQAALLPERLVLRLSRNIHKTAGKVFHKEDGSALSPQPDQSGRSMPSDLPGQLKTKDGAVLFGPPLNLPVTFLETGLRFEADVLYGQKTGFFLDQRENRRKAETLAIGRRLLNAFSFSGGFSVYAARGGACSVTDLDISAHALASARRNFGLNSHLLAVTRCPHETVQAEAFDWLAANRDRVFDMIILDPPSLAKRESERAGALRAYARLASLAIGHLTQGGILLACSCSAHVTADEFFEVIRRAIVNSGRRFQEIQTTGQPSDHPAAFKEAEYLKAIYLLVR